MQFPSSSDKEIFVAPFIPKDPPEQTVKASGNSFEYTVGAYGSNDNLYVWDRATNNIATKAMSDVGTAWKLSEADFKLVGNIKVHVEHEGKPLEAAQVILTIKGKSEQRLLDPTSKGDITFFGFPAGDATVKAVYNMKDGKQGSQSQIFKLPSKRDQAEPIFSLSIGDQVATAATTSSEIPGAKQSTEAQPKETVVDSGSQSGKFVFTIVALILVAGIVYFLVYMMKNNREVVEDRLKKLGVQIPQQADPNDQVGSVPAPLPTTPVPPQKIVLDDADPIPLSSSTSPSPQAPIVSTGNPTLVGESGVRTSLSEGETIVGREDGLAIALVGESTVSRRHASLSKSGNEVTLKDLGSTNGTFVNGNRLQGETLLRPGDQVQFGSVKFRYEG